MSKRYTRKRELIKKEFSQILPRQNFRSKYNTKRNNISNNFGVAPKLVRKPGFRNLRNATRKIQRFPEMRNVRNYGLIPAPVQKEMVGNYNIVRKGDANQYSVFHTSSNRNSVSSKGTIESLSHPRKFKSYNGEYIPASVHTLKNRMKNMSNNEQNRLLNIYSEIGFPRQ